MGNYKSYVSTAVIITVNSGKSPRFSRSTSFLIILYFYNMRKHLLFPSIFIIMTALLLISLTEFTGLSLPSWLSYIAIISSMLTGVWLSKSLNRKQG